VSTEKFSKGQQWGALKKAWKGYKIAKVHRNEEDMRMYAQRIRTLCEQIGIDKPKFPDLDAS
jgi:hypothetical protein